LLQLLIILLITFFFASFIYKRIDSSIFVILFIAIIPRLFRMTYLTSIGSYEIHVYHILILILLFATLLRIFKKTIDYNTTIVVKLFYFLMSFFIFNLFIGFFKYGFTAFAWATGMGLSLLIIYYISTFSYNEEIFKRIYLQFFYIGLILLSIAYLRWFNIIPSIITEEYSTLDFQHYRVIERDSIAVLFLLFYSFILFIFHLKIKLNFSKTIYLVLLVITIIFAQTRSFWVSGVIVLLYLSFNYTKKNVIFLISAGFILIFVYFIVKTFDNSVLNLIMYSITDAATEANDPNHSNYSFRLLVSELYINKMTFYNYLIGTPFGTPPPIIPGANNDTMSFGIHNEYVDILYHLGTVALIIFSLLNIILLKRLYYFTKNKYSILPNYIYEILFIGILYYLVFSWANTFDAVYPIMLGISISIYSINRNLSLQK